MSAPEPKLPNEVWKTTCTFLILAAAAVMTGRVFGVHTQSLGDNDRSRWLTVRALVDSGTYVIGRREATPPEKYRDVGIAFEKDWNTVDKVLNPDTHEFYSSKPPLLPTLAAGEYLFLQQVFGLSIIKDKSLVQRIILLTFNVLPITIYLVLLGRLIGEFGTTYWSRLYVMVAACFGTYITTFSVTFTNHTIAACCVLFAIYPLMRGFLRGAIATEESIIAGVCAGVATAFELPAASFAVGLGIMLLCYGSRRQFAWFAVGATIPVVALLLTNYAALGRFMPAYSEVGGPWYQYEGSYWNHKPGDGRTEIDWMGDEEAKWDYSMNLLYGHHGLLSLTPVFLLSILGTVAALRDKPQSLSPEAGSDDSAVENARRRLVWMLAILTALVVPVVIGFYIVQTSNYGGTGAGPRWLFWLTPLLLLMALPAADRLSEPSWSRLVAHLVLAVSIFSSSFPAAQVWRHPWIYQLLQYWELLPK